MRPDEEFAGHHIILLDPRDYTKLYLLGVNVESSKSDLDDLTSEGSTYEGLTIIPQNVEPENDGIPLYVKELAYLPFQVVKKEVWNERGEEGEDDLMSNCELVVTATVPGAVNRQAEGNIQRYFGVTSAHAFLTEDQRRKLRESSEFAEDCQREMIESMGLNTRLSLRAHRSEEDQEEDQIMSTPLNVRQAPLLAYRHYYKNEPEPVLLDIALMEILGSQLQKFQWRQEITLPNMQVERQEEPNMQVERLQIANTRNGLYKVKGLLLIRSPNDIEKLHKKKVLVDLTSGTIEHPPGRARRHANADGELGLHLTLSTKHP